RGAPSAPAAAVRPPAEAARPALGRSAKATHAAVAPTPTRPATAVARRGPRLPRTAATTAMATTTTPAAKTIWKTSPRSTPPSYGATARGGGGRAPARDRRARPRAP